MQRQQNIAILIFVLVPFLITVGFTLWAIPKDPWAEVDAGSGGAKKDPATWDGAVDVDGSKHWSAVTGDTSQAGWIEVEVTYAGPPIGKRPIKLGSFADCAAVHGNNPVFDEKRLVNEGKVPWAFVQLSKKPAGASIKVPPPRALDQKGCVYVPHVVGLMVGQGLHVRNGDRTNHNVNMKGSGDNPTFNKGQGIGADVFRLTFKTPTDNAGDETTCQIHAWMSARIHVVPHPFFCTTNEQGKGKIERVPPGTYTLLLKHESFSASSQTVEVTKNKGTTVVFKVK